MGFTNSPLVVHTRLSPNYSTRQSSKIDHIAIHCMAGDCSIETCGNIFAPESAGASSNYGIGSDGRIGMYVEEKHRAWCTGGEKVCNGYTGAQIDHRAVSIEVANITRDPDWKISDKAYASLVNLCVDICKRNGMPGLFWSGQQSDVGNPAKLNIAVHRWFAYKACPGDDIMRRLPQLCKDVNAKLAGKSGSTTVAKPAPNPKEQIWNFLKSKGLNDFAVAGVMGNLYAESGLQANNLQNSFEKGLGYNDAEYTKAVDSGKYTRFVEDCAGYGLAQWTYHTRKKALLEYAKKTKKSIGDTGMQMEYLWIEFQNYSKMMSVLKSAKSVQQASDIVLTEFERPADMSDAVKKKRASFGQEYYNKYAGKGTPNVAKIPYIVRVTGNPLNIRTGPGTNYGCNGDIRDNGCYTIVQESKGTGATMWGKLKSGAGWISLDWAKKL